MNYTPVEQMVLMQAFYWEAYKKPNWWNLVAHEVPHLHRAGFDGIWLPPASDSADKQGYLPRELYNLHSAYGTQKALQSLIATTHRNRMIAIADVVLNHRVGTKSHSDFTSPTWGSDAVVCDDEYPGTGGLDTGMGFHAGRDIDHTNEEVRRSIIEWLLWLKNIGFDGWRYDFVRGFAGKCIEIYNAATNPLFSVGEYWDDFDLENPNAHRQRLCNWLDSHKAAMAFDYTTKGLLQWAVLNQGYQKLQDNQARPAGLIGWWPEMAVTFVDNHDTGIDSQEGQRLWPFPTEELMQGYAYILLHPGIPCVYWSHYFNTSGQTSGLRRKIDHLIEVRKRCGVRSNSPVEILDATNTHYAAVIAGRVCVKIGRDEWTPPFSWTQVINEPNYRVWVA